MDSTDNFEEEPTEFVTSPLQILYQNAVICFHNQPDEFRVFLQAITAQYQKNAVIQQHSSSETSSFLDDNESEESLSMPNVAGPPVHMRDSLLFRALKKEPSSSSQLVATRVSCLQFVSCNIKDITNIFQMVYLPKLSHLNLSFNSLRTFNFSNAIIASLSSTLTILDLSHNKLTSIDGLAQFSNLKILRLHNNQIENLSQLESCFSLEELWLSYNKIDWIQFIYISKLEKLKILIKMNNLCDQKPKFNEFLVMILPDLRILDQEKVDKKDNNNIGLQQQEFDQEDNNTNVHNEAISNYANTASTPNPKISVDVKIMLTQAKAFMKRRSSLSIAAEETPSKKTSSFDSAVV
jgi:Leucine-rich repeat (LRR) protein